MKNYEALSIKEAMEKVEEPGVRVEVNVPVTENDTFNFEVTKKEAIKVLGLVEVNKQMDLNVLFIDRLNAVVIG